MKGLGAKSKGHSGRRKGLAIYDREQHLRSLTCTVTAKEAYSLVLAFRRVTMTATFKRSLLFFFFGDLLSSLFIFLFIHWLKLEIMLFHKQIFSSSYNLLLVLRNFLRGFENVLPAFL